MLLLLLALAAQDTTCVQTGTTIRCREERPLDYGAIMRSGADTVPKYQAPPVDRDAVLRQRVGKLLAKGKCVEAVNLALEGGEISLAVQVRDFCAKQ